MAKVVKDLVKSERYVQKPTDEVIDAVVDELEAMLVERTKQAREYTILVFWEAGQMMRNAEKEHKVNISSLVTSVARDNRISGRQMGERNLWMALKIHDTYPVFEKVYSTPHGENISLSKIKKELTTPRPKKEPTIEEMAMHIYEKFGTERTQLLVDALTKLIKVDHDEE